MHPSMQHLARMRTKDKQREQERRAGLRPEVAAPYGSSSSYTPATDACSAPFVPSADVYSPPPADPAPSYEGGGGSFNGGGPKPAPTPTIWCNATCRPPRARSA